MKPVPAVFVDRRFVVSFPCAEEFFLTLIKKSTMENIQKFGMNFKERVENALKKLREGKGILLTDDESRENEGDIIFPASTITDRDMALMIRECSGIVCLCLTKEKSKLLNLKPMVEHNMSRNKTAFTITILSAYRK